MLIVVYMCISFNIVEERVAGHWREGVPPTSSARIEIISCISANLFHFDSLRAEFFLTALNIRLIFARLALLRHSKLNISFGL